MRGGLQAVLSVLIAGHLSAVRGHDSSSDRPLVEGRVLNDQDEPIPGADIYWCPRDADFEDRDGTVHAAADAEGRFRLEAPETLRGPDGGGRIGRLWIVAENHGIEVVPAKDFRVQPDGRRKASVKLFPAAPFRFRVVDPERRPREGELVEPILIVIRDEELGSAQHQLALPRLVRDRLAGITDDNGECRIVSLKQRSRIGFRVVSEKFGIQDEVGTEERGETPVVTFGLRATARLEGSTLGDNRKAFAGTRLLVRSFAIDVPLPNPGEVHRIGSRVEVVVGQDGRFEVPAIGSGVLLVSCANRGGIDSPVITAPHTLAPGATGTITLAIEPTAIFKGQVVTEGTNEPVADALVEISAGGKRDSITARTNGKGEYSVTSFARPSQLRANAAVVESRSTVEVQASPDSKEVICPPIKLPPTRKISGRLIDSTGQPVVAAEVVGLEVAVLHGSGMTAKDGRFEMLTAAERKITDYLVHLNGESRAVTIRNLDPLELVLDEPAKK